MEAIAWILGIGIFTGLLLTFPKKMGILIAVIAVLAVVIAGTIFGYNAFTTYQTAQTISKLEVFIQHDVARCSAEYPLLVGLMNGTDDTITKTTFSISGFREGYSEALYETDYREYSTDRIMLPGEGSWTCWRIPNRAYGTSDDVIKRYPPESLVWTVPDLHPVFENS